MATTLENLISPDSQQYEEHIATIKFQYIFYKYFQNLRHL